MLPSGFARFLLLAGALGVQLACGMPRSTAGTASVRSATGGQRGPLAAHSPAAHPPAARAQLVVSVIFDQLGSQTLLEHLDLLSEEGAIRQALLRGSFFERSEYPQAHTLTAPGHAVTYTGVPPEDNGVDVNALWDRESARVVHAVADSRYPVFGRGGEVTAGPGRLRVATVAHALVEHTQGAARVVSLSLKDRAAIFPVGTRADAVLWFDVKLGRFTSSGAWYARLPDWVERHQRENPLSALLEPWRPLSPERYRARLGPDDAPGEGPLPGGTRSFPHRFDVVAPPWRALRASPRLSEYLIGLAEAAVRAESLGGDAVPDLLMLSISGTDYVGHAFGPRSWEYVDHLVRADLALGRWLARLEQRMPISVLLTSDHGVAPLPESERAGQRGARVVPDRLSSRLRQRLDSVFGPGPWVERLLPPYLYLSEEARGHPRAQEMVQHAIEALTEADGVAAAYAISDVRGWRDSRDPLRRSLAVALAPEASPDVVIVTAPRHPLDIGRPDGVGTHHGSPHDYDRQVPVLAFGVGVPHARHAALVSQLSVAPTLSRLLGVPAPGQASSEPLF